MKQFLSLVVFLLLTGCQAGYYTHLLSGQYDLLSRRVPLDDVLADGSTPKELRAALTTASDARTFAIDRLGLPDNGSYTQYADLERPYVLWNVMATPELSLEPVEWCYPFMGCFAYRGYYDESRAQELAQELKEQGKDVVVSGIAAYSTLGWFDDPVLNTMVGRSPEQLSSLIFHELAHQRLHIKNDTAFNESFARFVEEQGLRESLFGRGDQAQEVLVENQRRDEFVGLILAARERLQAAYKAGGGEPELRRRKAEEFDLLRSEYARMKESWGGDGRYDAWMSRELNNASLLPFGLYHQWVPAFAALFHDSGSSWELFYSRCAELGDMGPGPRAMALQELRERGLRL